MSDTLWLAEPPAQLPCALRRLAQGAGALERVLGGTGGAIDREVVDFASALRRVFELLREWRTESSAETN